MITESDSFVGHFYWRIKKMSRNQLAQRSDGRFKVNYKNKQFYGKSKKEALRKRDEYVALERAGIDYDCCDTPFTEYGLR